MWYLYFDKIVAFRLPYRVPLSRNVSSGRPSPDNTSSFQFAASNPQSAGGTVSRFVYANFMRSNAAFVTSILAIAMVGGAFYDDVFDKLWRMNNKGKLFDDVIPVQFPKYARGTEPEEETPAEE